MATGSAPDRPTDDRLDRAITEAEAKLAKLGMQVETIQAVLVRLLQDVVDADAGLDRNQKSRLIAANEQLVVAALTSQSEAAAAVQALKDALPSVGLDALTNLPNRAMLVDRFLQSTAQARRHDARLAVLFLDLDNFKQLNDTRGHPTGDKALCLVADRMRAVVREVDTVSRHGGDEFLILLPELNRPQDARSVAEKLIAAIGAPAEIEGQPVVMSASIGIAIYPDDGQDLDTLIQRADAAMYQAKRRGAGGVAFHDGTSTDDGAIPAAPVTAHDADDIVRDRHAQLREANERLVLAALSAHELHTAAEEAHQRQNALMSAVADELRNPMAPIRIAAAMLGRPSSDEQLLPRVQQLVDTHMSQIARLVDRLSDTPAAGDAPLVAGDDRVDMNRVIEASIDAHRAILDEHGKTFVFRRPDQPIVVRGDATRLEQVVDNLLENACRYTRDGGRIVLTVDVSDDTLLITVSDNGIGITPQMLPRLFAPFVQDPLALGMNGVGIGLTAARTLVRAHGGDLVAYSAGAGQGSQFVVTLPLAARTTPAPDAIPAPDTAVPER